MCVCVCVCVCADVCWCVHLNRIFPLISSSCRAAFTDIPDPLSPLLPIVHHLWLVFRATSRIPT